MLKGYRHMHEALRLLKLSYDLDADGPLPPTIPPVKIEPYYEIQRDGANVFVITFANHSGTHIDAPRHVAAHGIPLSDFALREFQFSHPICIDLESALHDDALIGPEHLEHYRESLQDCDVLLIRTGYGRFRESDRERYRYRAPGFSVRGAEYVRDNLSGIRCIGMDTISFACIAHLEEGMEAHRVLLCPPTSHFLLIEDVNLNFDLSRIRSLLLYPWLIRGVDSAPCTVIATIHG